MARYYYLFIIFSIAFLAIVCEIQHVQTKHTAANKYFKAAVYEHKQIEAHQSCYDGVCERGDALSSVMDNLNTYSAQTRKAKQEGAKIIVFPEFGLTPWVTRNQLIPFSENIPSVAEPGKEWIPCDDHNLDGHITIQQRLSCMARENQIYVVANLVDYQECNECGENFCLYNTNVMYDKSGKHVAKYHKYNLFNSEFPLFNIDKEVQNEFVHTDFGVLGFVICEDLLWQYPTVDLVKTNNVDTIIFSTEWWDGYPYTLPHVDQASWAKALQVNFIASNLHDASVNNSGSGIYTTEGTIDYYHDISNSSEGRLIVAELPVRPTRTSQIEWNKYFNSYGDEFPIGAMTFQSQIWGDTVNLVEMDPNEHITKVCSSNNTSFCCIASYDYSASDEDGKFSLGAFEGIHTDLASVRGSMGFALCTVVKCNANTSHLCDSVDYSYSGISNTYFTKLELSGNFDSDTMVFPQSVFTEVQLMPQLEKVWPDGRIGLNLTNGNENMPLVSMTLWGRKYGQDGDAPTNWCPETNNINALVPNIKFFALAIISLIMLTWI